MYKPRECRGEKVMYIHEMQVRKEERGKGKGREAFEMCVREGKEMGRTGVMLQVAYSNIEARGMYEKWGTTEGMSNLKEQQDGECYQIRERIWEDSARARLERKREAEMQRKNMEGMRVRRATRIGEEFQAEIRTGEEEKEEQGRDGVRTGRGGEEAIEEGGKRRTYITTATDKEREMRRRIEREKGSKRGGQKTSHLAETGRWEERAITRDDGGVKKEWEIWYKGPGEKEAALWLQVKSGEKEEGRYLVAGRDFKDKEAVVTYCGDEITKEELKELEKVEGRADHVMQIGARYIDGRTHLCGGQYMNTAMWEGQANNVKMMGAPHGTLRIHKEGGVMKGEELLLDYGNKYWESEERQRRWREIGEAG